MNIIGADGAQLTATNRFRIDTNYLFILLLLKLTDKGCFYLFESLFLCLCTYVKISDRQRKIKQSMCV